MSSIDQTLKEVREGLKDLKELKEFLLEKEASTSGTEIPSDIDESALFLNKSKNTIYAMVRNKEIPHYKHRNRLYFFKSELAEWLKGFSQKTKNDINDEVDSILSKKK